MDSPTFDAHRQLSCFMALNDDDEMAQMILEELSYPRRSYVNVAATLACSPSSKTSESGLNSITEDDREEDEDDE
uniref:Uncharacterized protein n=1 Tax=Globisporangium ultimum (strain ATCC 200006 / CBS 805.95 / DAOM BR144) TaxID=431595 RepID=K3WEB6_GLOUD